MYIASFYPQPMGGLEMQGLKLAKKLGKQGVKSVIVTHGFAGCKKSDVYEGVDIIRLYSWLNTLFEAIRFLKRKIAPGSTKVSQIQLLPPGQLPYKKSDTGIKVNGGLFDLIYYLIQLINFVWQFRKIKKQTGIIHVHGVPWVSFIGVQVGRFYRIPVLIKESTTIGFQKYDDILLGERMRATVVKYGTFIAISQFIKNEMLRWGIPENRIFYIPNGVEVADQPASESSTDFNILFVGNLSQGAAKGLDVLLSAMQNVVKQYPTARLLVAGNNPDPVSWNNYVSGLAINNNVDFLGSENKLTEVYKKTTVFVSPSRREGLSNALLEAMAYGLPCIVTNISGSQDMIENSISGLVVEPDNVAQLTEAILKIFSSSAVRKTMRQEAHARVKEMCCFQKVAEQYNTVYKLLQSKATA